MKSKKLIIVTVFIVALVVLGIFLYLTRATNSNQSENNGNQQPSVPLEVEQLTSQLTTLGNSASFTIKSNKELTLDNSRAKLYLSKSPTEEDNLYWYVVEVTNLGLGDSTVRLELKDLDGSIKPLAVQITREGFTLPFGLKELSDWEGKDYTADGDNFLAQVDKEHKLPNDYAPKELLDVNRDLLLYTNSATPILVRREAGESLLLMAKALQKEKGKNLVVMSGYRSYDDQYRTYAGWVRQLGQEEADKVSARPGFSEHQLGTSVDFVDQETGLNLTNDFSKGVAGQWLLENAYKYGFVQSYPEGKSEITGYQHEAWHWRFVGIENAKEIKESGLTLKEWLERN